VDIAILLAFESEKSRAPAYVIVRHQAKREKGGALLVLSLFLSLHASPKQ
jgi:hypothetical protein